MIDDAFNAAVRSIERDQHSVASLFALHRAERPWFHFLSGRVPWRDRRFTIEVGFGFRPDAEPGEIRWRYWRSWSIPRCRLIRRGRQIIGFEAWGRCRVFR